MASLSLQVANAVTKVISALGDLAPTITYHSVLKSVYDSSTDTYTEVATVISCKAAVYKAKIESMEWKRTELTETKVLIAGQVFSDASIIPKEEDFMTIKGTKYQITTLREIPGESGYTFTVKAV